MTCPNDEKNFSKILTKILGHTPSPIEREKIFYRICIPVRLLILFLLYKYRDNNNVQHLFVVLSLISVINLGTYGGPNTHWWSKNFQLVMSLLMFLIGILVIKEKTNPIYIPVLFGFSVFSGFLQSFLIKFC
jgi:peptidoglycan/LPS O-acetylase OafA/YrhL